MKKSLGHDRYPSGRKRPPSRTIATSSGVNREFHKKGLSYSPGIRGKFKKYRALRGLKQIDFASLALWSEMRCKKTWKPNSSGCSGDVSAGDVKHP